MTDFDDTFSNIKNIIVVVASVFFSCTCCCIIYLFIVYRCCRRARTSQRDLKREYSHNNSPYDQQNQLLASNLLQSDYNIPIATVIAIEPQPGYDHSNLHYHQGRYLSPKPSAPPII